MVASYRSRLERGTVGAHTADRRLRTALEEAQRLHTMSESERKKDGAGRAFSAAMSRGTTFLAAVRELEPSVPHLDASQARTLAGVLSELGAVTGELARNGSAPRSSAAASVPLPPVRVPAPLYERLSRLAKMRRCSIGTLVEQILADNVGLQEMSTHSPPVASPLMGYGAAGPRPAEPRRPRRTRGSGARVGP